MKHLLVILSLIILSACGKERTFHIKAQNPATGEPYDGIRVVVTSSKTGWNGEKYKTEHDGHLDSNGEAMINVKVKNNRTYSVQCEEPSNTCYTKDIELYLKDHDEKNPSFLFEYAECANLKLKIENVNCQGAGDVMNFRQRYSYTDWSGWSSDRDGCYSYESTNYFQVANGFRIYEWKVNRGGDITTHIDSIFLDINDNQVFEINY